MATISSHGVAGLVMIIVLVSFVPCHHHAFVTHAPIGVAKLHRTLFEKCSIDDNPEDMPAIAMGYYTFLDPDEGNRHRTLFRIESAVVGIDTDKFRIMVPKIWNGTAKALKDLVFERFITVTLKIKIESSGMAADITVLDSEIQERLQHFQEENRVLLLVYGSDFDSYAGGMGGVFLLLLNPRKGTAEHVSCMETLPRACQAMEGSELESAEAFKGEATKVFVMLSNRSLHYGSWILRVERDGMMQQDMDWNAEQGVMETVVRFREAGTYTLRAYLMFPNATLAKMQIVGELDLDNIFCGEALKPLTVHVSPYCPSGNVKGDWVLVRELSLDRQSEAFLPPAVQFPVYEWTPASKCSLRWWTGNNIHNVVQQEMISEIVFMGDSRELSLIDALKHVISDSVLRSSHLYSKEYLVFDGLCKVVAAYIRTEEQYGNSSGPFGQMTKNAIAGIQEHELCLSEKKGLILLSIPLFDLRHMQQFEENGMDLLIVSLKERCPNHRIVLLAMQGVHDDVAFLVKQPMFSYKWATFQNRLTLIMANDLIAEAAKKHKLSYCDLFAPTDSRNDASLDGVHYLLSRFDNSYLTPFVDGRNVTHVLIQLILNTIFPTS